MIDGGTFQVGCDVLVELRRRVRSMPGAPIGLRLSVRHLGERLMNGVPVSDTARPVGRGADQRVTEPHSDPDLDEAGGLGWSGRAGLDPNQAGRSS